MPRHKPASLSLKHRPAWQVWGSRLEKLLGALAISIRQKHHFGGQLTHNYSGKSDCGEFDLPRSMLKYRPYPEDHEVSAETKRKKGVTTQYPDFGNLHTTSDLQGRD